MGPPNPDLGELGLGLGHVGHDLRVDEGVGVDAPNKVLVVPLLEGNLVVVVHGREGGAQPEHVLLEEKRDFTI